MQQFAREHGRIFVMSRLNGESLVVTSNPNDFETIFRHEGQWPQRVGLETLHYHRTKHRHDFFQGVQGLLPSNGKEWATFRSAVNPVLMQPKNVQLYLHKMSNVNKQFIARIREIRDPITMEMPANFEDEINRFTLETISTVALDKQLGLFQGLHKNDLTHKLYTNLKEFFQLSMELNLKPSLWKYIATKDFKRLMQVLDEVLDITKGFVQEAIVRLEAEQANGIKRTESEQSVLEKLLKIDKHIAVVMAMDMFFGGVDSSSTVLAGILLCLAKHPAKQEKLRAKLRQILPQKHSEFTLQTLKSVPYLRACLKEAMRLYPFVLFNIRVPQQSITLSGYEIPSGTVILMAFSDILRNEQYFTKPNEFIPERWLRAGTTAETSAGNLLKPSSPFLHTPFGFGARTCVGRRIVEMELELCVARIVRNFQVDFKYPIEHVFKSEMVNLPNKPLKFKFDDID